MRNCFTLLFLLATLLSRPETFTEVTSLPGSFCHTLYSEQFPVKNYPAVNSISEVCNSVDYFRPKLKACYIHTDTARRQLKSGNPSHHAVRFHEFMPDPFPSAGLPEAEYIELVNEDTVAFDLDGWVISDLSSSVQLQPYLLNPGEFIILCSPADTGDLSEYGNTMGVSNLPSLNNSSDKFTLIAYNGDTIDMVEYNINWHTETFKKEGGWSLERSRGEGNCSDRWRSSLRPEGGSPGIENSQPFQSTDQVPPEILNVFSIHPDTVEIWFDEAPWLLTTDHIYLTGEPPLSGLVQESQLVFKLLPGKPLTASAYYEIVLTQLSDCAGNDTSLKVRFQAGISGKKGDLIINEVLFNPRTGGSDFVEIYNRAGSPVHLSGWQLATLGNMALSDQVEVGNYGTVIPPGAYFVVTPDSQNIMLEYPFSSSGTFLETSNFPSYNNEYGHVILVEPSGEVAESFEYHEDMHFGLIDDPEGVSLERVSHNQPASDHFNWHSAASTAGFATPGARNSQSGDVFNQTTFFEATPAIFSPDQDGYQDLLILSYSIEDQGYVANITIYDMRGFPIRHLVKNDLLGTSGGWSWDGLDDEGNIAGEGIYVTYLSRFSAEGHVILEKLPVVLAKKT